MQFSTNCDSTFATTEGTLHILASDKKLVDWRLHEIFHCKDRSNDKVLLSVTFFHWSDEDLSPDLHNAWNLQPILTPSYNDKKLSGATYSP